MGMRLGRTERVSLGWLIVTIRDAYTAGAMKRSIRGLGLEYPSMITSMYLSGEAPEYMEAAVIAVNQRGE
jgi:hypothetical protein